MDEKSLGTFLALCVLTPFVAPVYAEQQDAAASGALQEVIVTAQKLSQDVQKTAATVTVIQSDTLMKQGATDLRALSAFSPMADLGKEGQNTQVFIRGIGQETDDDANDPAAALYVDQVYMPREALSSSLFDVDRVEIVAGPQGTLYGRDAVGGAVNVYSKKPTDQFSVESLLEGGNYGMAHAFGVVNTPISDSLRARIALDYHKHDGYLSYGGDDENSQSARIGILYAPTERFSNLIRAEYDHIGGMGDGVIVTPVCATVAVSDCQVPRDRWNDPAVGNYDNRRAIYKVINEANLTFGNGLSATSITGYVDLNNRFSSPIGTPQTLINWSNLSTDFLPPDPLPPNPLYGGSYRTFQRKKQWSEELRLAQETPKYHWVSGLYWLHFNTNTPPSPFFFPQIPDNLETLPGVGCGPDAVGPVSFQPNPGPCFASQPLGSDNVINDSYAAFADGTYSILDWLRLNIGLRLSIDHKSTEGVSSFIAYGDVAGATPTFFAATNTWHHLDWKAGVEGDIPQLPSSHFYAKVETGYVEGGVNDAPGNQNSPTVTGSSYEPEKVLAFTLGLKNRFWGNRLQLNDEIFYYDYQDLQLAAFSGTAGGTIFFNAPKSVSYGNQLDIELRATPSTQLGLDVGVLRSHVKEATLPPATTYLPGNTLSNLTIPPAFLDASSLGGANGLPIDYSGYELPNAPKLSLTGHVDQTFALSNGATIDVYVAARYASADWADYTHQPGSERPSYTKTDATLTYFSDHARWFVAIWGKNLENTWHGSTYGSNSIYGTAAWFVDQPRTFGGRVGMNF